MNRSRLIYDLMECRACGTLFDLRKADSHQTLPATHEQPAEGVPACPECGSTDIEHEDVWATRAATELVGRGESRIRRYAKTILKHAPERVAETNSLTGKPHEALKPGELSVKEQDSQAEAAYQAEQEKRRA